MLRSLMPDSRSNLSRRRLLRTGGAGLAALAAGTAGCVSALPPLGNQIRIGQVDVPEASHEPDYRRWVPSPGEFPDEYYHDDPIAVVPEAFANDAAPTSSIGYSILRSRVDYFGVGFDSYSLAVGVGRCGVLEGSFDRSAVRTTMEQTGYAPAGSYEGYELYDRPDGNRTVALGDGTIVFQSGGEDRTSLQALVQLAAGEARAYHETSESFDLYTRRLRLSPSVMFGFGVGGKEFDATHTSLSYRFDTEAVYYSFLQLYPDGANIPRSRMREVAREMAGDDTNPLVEIETDGRFAELQMRLDRSDLENERVTVPQVTWGWESDPAARTITIHHEAGDSIGASYLRIEHDGNPIDSQFGDEYETVEPGDSITVRVPDEGTSDELAIVFETADSSSVLARASLEESP